MAGVTSSHSNAFIGLWCLERLGLGVENTRPEVVTYALEEYFEVDSCVTFPSSTAFDEEDVVPLMYFGDDAGDEPNRRGRTGVPMTAGTELMLDRPCPPTPIPREAYDL